MKMISKEKKIAILKSVFNKDPVTEKMFNEALQELDN
jgi:hypothetical protein